MSYKILITILNVYFVCNYSTIIPERLDPFINKYAEYTHDKWAFEKVIIKSIQLNIFLTVLIDNVIHVCVVFSDPEQLVIWRGAGWKCKNTPDAPSIQDLLREGGPIIHHPPASSSLFSPQLPCLCCSRTRRSTAGQSRSPSRPWSPGSGTSIKPERKRSRTKRKQPPGRFRKLLR